MISLIPGDGVGKELAKLLIRLFKDLQIPLSFDIQEAGKEEYEKHGVYLPDSLFRSLEKNKVAIKGPMTTPIGEGFRSLNVQLRKKYDLYTNIRPIKELGPWKNPDRPIDLVIFRENTEDLYRGVEEMISDTEAHSIKIITYQGSRRLIKRAFDYALDHGYPKVTLVTKANIMKFTDGLFLKAGRDLAKDYPSIELEEVLVDNMAMQLVLNPYQFNVIATENLYGDILSDLSAGLIGGLGLVPGANIGDDMAIFESVHGTAPDLAGKDLVNPTAFFLSACMMLDYLDMGDYAGSIRQGLDLLLSKKETSTQDLGGPLKASEFTTLLIQRVKEIKHG